MNELLSELLNCLALTPEGDDLFRGVCERDRHGRIFGGQVLGQALMAAGRTVPDRPAHSMQAYFLRAGDRSQSIDFEVERLRDGRSFSARRVIARQGSREVLAMQASFHALEPGYEHQDPMPDVPPPESLPSAAELVKRMRHRFPARSAEWATKPRSIEMRHAVLPCSLGGEPSREPGQAWFRADAVLPDDPLLHQCVIAYASDMAFNDNALRPHSGPDEPELAAMSTVDHSIWFHEPARADEWLLFQQESPKAAWARGFVRGAIFTRTGKLIASVGQDSLMRPQRAQTTSSPRSPESEA